MNYCTRCGNKLEEGNKFCPKCGNPTNLYIEEKKKLLKQKNEDNKERLLLGIGTLLVIVASIIFAYANWNDMTGIFKVLFLLIESFLFLSISIFSKKVNEKLPYKFLWFIGISFIPIIFNLIACDKLLGEYLSYEGAGIFTYLAISSFICAIVYYLSNKLLKTNLFLYFTYIFSYLTVIFALYILKLDSIFKYNLIFPIISIINLCLCIFYTKFKEDNIKKTLNIFLSILVSVSSILACIFTISYEYEYILIGIVTLSNIASLLTILFRSNKNVVIYAYPFISYILINYGMHGLFTNYANVIAFTIVLGSILINLIINLKEDRILNIISFILMLLNTSVILLGEFSYLTTLIISIILILNYLFIIKLNNLNIEAYMSKIILPILLLTFIYNFTNVLVNMKLEIIYLIVSIICYTVSVTFHQKKKDKFTKNVFEVYSYLYLFISSTIILFTNTTEISFILNELIWIYYYVFNSILKKESAINITLLILLIFNFIMCSFKFSISIFYSLIFIAIITSLLDFINRKFNKGSYYIYISIASVALAALYDFSNISLIGLGLLVLTYVFSYYLLVNKHNLNFIFKYLFTLVGFIIISIIYNYFISTVALANLFIVLTYIIILISMYLLRVDSDDKIFGYYIVVAIGLFNLIDTVDFMQKYSITLNTLVSISIILVYFENVFKLKESDKIIIEIVLLAFIHLCTLFDIVIFNFILSAFYIFYGFYKKRGSFSILGTALLIVTLLINIYKIANNITVTYVLLVIGLIMLGYVFYIEARKNNKK